MEIERKFLVAERPDLEGREGIEIEQGYLAVGDGGDDARSGCVAGRRPAADRQGR